jgi:hypothetical protein
MGDVKAEYIARCTEEMLKLFGGQIQIRIKQAGNPAHYPAGTWFDGLIGQVLEPAGVDSDSIPSYYVMSNGDAVPFSCADIIES